MGFLYNVFAVGFYRIVTDKQPFGHLRTGEAFGQLVKTQFESATDNVQASVAKATKAAKGK